MKGIIYLIGILASVGCLASCASTSTAPDLAPRNQGYQSATTSEPYMFRSPPPAAVSAIHAGHGGR